MQSVLWWNKGACFGDKEEKNKGLVVSGGLDGLIIFWIMDPSRTETPTWSESDSCQICASPFFWNVRKMWNVMAVGVRQVS